MRSRAKRKFNAREDDEYPGGLVGALHQPDFVHLLYTIFCARSSAFSTALSGESILGWLLYEQLTRLITVIYDCTVYFSFSAQRTFQLGFVRRVTTLTI